MARPFALIPLVLALALGACSSSHSSPGASATGQEAPPLDKALPVAHLSEAQEAVLDSQDCSVVAHGYADALANHDFRFAARFWADPVIDGPRLQARFRDYLKPVFTITRVSQVSTAHSHYCTASGTLRDGGDPHSSPTATRVLFRRVDAVTGAGQELTRWHIEYSTLVTRLDRSRHG